MFIYYLFTSLVVRVYVAFFPFGYFAVKNFNHAQIMTLSMYFLFVF